MTIGARHAGLVLALALVAPLLSHNLDQGGQNALLGATRVALDGNAPISAEGADRAAAPRHPRGDAEGEGSRSREAVRRARRGDEPAAAGGSGLAGRGDQGRDHEELPLGVPALGGARRARAASDPPRSAERPPGEHAPRNDRARAPRRRRGRPDRARARSRRALLRRAASRRSVHFQAGVLGRRDRRRRPAVRARDALGRRLPPAHDARGARALVRPGHRGQEDPLDEADDRRSARAPASTRPRRTPPAPASRARRSPTRCASSSRRRSPGSSGSRRLPDSALASASAGSRKRTEAARRWRRTQ